MRRLSVFFLLVAVACSFAMCSAPAAIACDGIVQIRSQGIIGAPIVLQQQVPIVTTAVPVFQTTSSFVSVQSAGFNNFGRFNRFNRGGVNVRVNGFGGFRNRGLFQSRGLFRPGINIRVR